MFYCWGVSLTEDLIKKMHTYGAQNYLPLPVVLNKGKGSRVWDVEGKEYLDFLACYCALNFGHGHPRIVKALKDQVDKLAVCSRAFHSEQLSLFSEELTAFSGFDKALLMNSGAEAVESALKIARKWGSEVKGVPSSHAKIIAMENNFHGRTISLISFSTEPTYRDGFGPYTPGFEVIPFGDFSALEKKIDKNTIAVLLEPIQAEAGILLPPAGYLKKVRELCTFHNTLLILDEIQTGLGRTGKDFCFEHDGISPDVVILGKSLGGGVLPISAVLTNEEVMEVIRPGQHGSTFGGNPLACAVARECLKVLREEKLASRAEHLGSLMMTALQGARLPNAKEIRGKGALVGIELEKTTGGARKYCEKLAERGILCKETHDFVIRLAPPLVISDEDLKRGLDVVASVIREFE